MNIFCTLFDSRYLDKGLALYYSLARNAKDFKLYIFAFDTLCEEVLLQMDLPSVVVVSLRDFETEELQAIKASRSRAEYCWTCTPLTIQYVLQTYNEKSCTYIDADIYFFSDPIVLFEEVRDTDFSVIITPHRFPKSQLGEALEARNGKYCVEFNTFNNDSQGNRVLSWWAEKCKEWCFYSRNGEGMGDQMYLNNWPAMFPGVHELAHLGGGVAPWNIDQYILLNTDSDKIRLLEKTSQIQFNLIFYHFQNISYISYDLVNIKSQCTDKRLKEAIYYPYLSEIELIRAYLKNTFGFVVPLGKTCSTNPVIAFIQRNIMKYKVKSVSDLVPLKGMRNYDSSK